MGRKTTIRKISPSRVLKILKINLQWIDNLCKECEERNYQHITEHWGFMTAGGTTDGAPLPVPYTPGYAHPQNLFLVRANVGHRAVRVGRERLQKMFDGMGRRGRIGLENLALAMGMRDVIDQPAFIADLLEPFGDQGMMLLDLHNLYCQIHNFKLKPEEAMKR